LFGILREFCGSFKYLGDEIKKNEKVGVLWHVWMRRDMDRGFWRGNVYGKRLLGRSIYS
jgi:hypothetical protein